MSSYKAHGPHSSKARDSVLIHRLARDYVLVQLMARDTVLLKANGNGHATFAYRSWQMDTSCPVGYSHLGAPAVVFAQWHSRWVGGPGPRMLYVIQQAPGE